ATIRNGRSKPNRAPTWRSARLLWPRLDPAPPIATSGMRCLCSGLISRGNAVQVAKPPAAASRETVPGLHHHEPPNAIVPRQEKSRIHQFDVRLVKPPCLIGWRA